MKMRYVLVSWLLVCLVGFDFASPTALQQQNEFLFQQLQRVHGLTDAQMNAIRKIFAKSAILGKEIRR